MRIRTLVGIAAGLIGGAGLLAGLSLILATSVLHRAAQNISEALTSVQAAQELQIALLGHNRESFLYGLTGAPENRNEAETHALAIERWNHEIAFHTDTAEEAALVEQVQHLVGQYLETRQRLAETGSEPLAAYRQIAVSLDAANRAVDRLVEVNVAEARAMEKRIQEQDALANLLGAVLAAFLFLCFFLLSVAVRRLLLRPLLQLRQAMAGYGKGEQQARAPVCKVQELNEIAQTFNYLVEQLGRQREQQLRFVAGVAHDLRTPLQAVRLSAQLLADDRGPTGPAQALDLISRQIRHLERMLDDLTETCRIEEGQLRLKPAPMDLRQLVEDSVDLWLGHARERPLELNLPATACPIQADPVRITQVLNNLLSNSLKYSPAGSPIKVTLQQEGEQVLVSVTDHGIGIAAEDQPHIFEPFRRTAATSSSVPGVGLGLSIARQIARAHGGELTFRSDLGLGSTFCLRLPVGRPAAGRGGAS